MKKYYSLFLVFVLCINFIGPTQFVFATDINDTLLPKNSVNLARGVKVTADSTWNEKYSVDLMTDDKNDTRWSSGKNTAESNLEISFGNETAINAIELLEYFGGEEISSRIDSIEIYYDFQDDKRICYKSDMEGAFLRQAPSKTLKQTMVSRYTFPTITTQDKIYIYIKAKSELMPASIWELRMCNLKVGDIDFEKEAKEYNNQTPTISKESSSFLPIGTVNLATGQNITADTTWSSNFLATNMLDNNLASRWSVADQTEDSKIEITFDKETTFNTIEFVEFAPELKSRVEEMEIAYNGKSGMQTAYKYGRTGMEVRQKKLPSLGPTYSLSRYTFPTVTTKDKFTIYMLDSPSLPSFYEIRVANLPQGSIDINAEKAQYPNEFTKFPYPPDYENIVVKYNNKALGFSEEPVVKDGIVLVPLNEISKKLNLEVDLDTKNNIVSIKKQKGTVNLELGKKTFVSLWKTVELPIAPYLSEKGNVIIPVVDELIKALGGKGVAFKERKQILNILGPREFVYESLTDEELYNLVYRTPPGESYQVRDKLSNINDFANLVLKPGHAYSIDFKVAPAAQTFGFTINNQKFTITAFNANGNASGKLANVSMLYLEDPDKVQWELYNTEVRDTTNVLVVRGTGEKKNTIYWYVEGGGLLGSQKFEYESLPDNAPFQFFPTSFPRAKVIALREGELDTIPKEKRVTPNLYMYILKDSNGVAGNTSQKNDYAKVDSKYGKLTQNEIDGMIKTLDNVTIDGYNYVNTYIFGHTLRCSKAAYYMYELTKDKRFLNYLVRYADIVFAARNDPIHGYYFRGGEKTPIWPHYGTMYYEDGKRRFTADMSDALPDPATFAARAISESKDLWDEIIPDDSGRTYKEACEKYVDMAVESLDSYVFKYYYNPDTGLFEYRDNIIGHPFNKTFQKDLPQALELKVPAWNRLFMGLNGAVDIVEAMYNLDIYPEKREFYKNSIDNQVEYFFTNGIRDSISKNKPCFIWNYMEGRRWIEDAGHAREDYYGIGKIYSTGRYKSTTNERMQKLANTIYYLMYKEGKGYSWYVDGTGTFVSFGNFEEYVKFVPELYEDYYNMMMKSNNFFEIAITFRMREKLFNEK